MDDRPPTRARQVTLNLRPRDARALRHVLGHLEAIAADYPEHGAGKGYTAQATQDMRRGVQLVAYLVQCAKYGQEAGEATRSILPQRG